LSANGPAAKAPSAQPSKTEATLNPVATLLELNVLPNADTVPFITPESKPNKKPPMAATADIKITYKSEHFAAALCSPLVACCVVMLFNPNFYYV
jgi:hypothetical protein